MHLLDLPKLKQSLEGQTNEDGKDLFEVERERILKEEAFTFDYLR